MVTVVSHLGSPSSGRRGGSAARQLRQAGRGDPEARAPELLLHDSAIESSVAGWLAELNPRQRQVIERRYGLNGCEVTTLEDLAAEIGVTRERVRQIQGEALDKLRAKLERRGYTRDALF